MSAGGGTRECRNGGDGAETRGPARTSQVLLAVIVLILTLPSLAGARTTAGTCETVYEHDGSDVRVSGCDEEIAIDHLHPREDLLRAGVEPSTPLFRGRRSANGTARLLDGTAYTFRSGCRPLGFRISGGWVIGSGMQEYPIALAGRAPERDGSCRIIGAVEKALDLAFVRYGDERVRDARGPTFEGCGWYVVMSCHESDRAAREASGNGFLAADTHDYPNLRGRRGEGRYCAVDGPWEAVNDVPIWSLKEVVPSAFIRRGC